MLTLVALHAGATAQDSTAGGFAPSAAPTTAPTTASLHDSLLGGSAVQDPSDVPSIFGSDNS